MSEDQIEKLIQILRKRKKIIVQEKMVKLLLTYILVRDLENDFLDFSNKYLQKEGNVKDERPSN